MARLTLGDFFPFLFKPPVKLTFDDYVSLGFAFFIFSGVICRFIVFRDIGNHIVSLILLGMGIYILYPVIKKLRGEEDE